jgi:hypothetical protein
MTSYASVVVSRTDPDPDTARRLLEEELRDPAYPRDGLLERLGQWLTDLWLRLSLAASDASPLVSAAAVAVVVSLLVLAGLAVSRVRRDTAPVRSRPGPSAAAHRQAALDAGLAGRHEDALVEGFRAIAARSVERGLLDATPGLTAHEIVVALTPLFPAHREGLSLAGARFDAVFYGDRPARPSDARHVLELDDQLARAAPAPGTLHETGAVR